MNRKAKEKALRKLGEANDALSPDISTAIVLAKSQTEAWRTAALFEEVTGDDLPVDLDKWGRSVQAPVQLYFVFKRRKDLGRFIRKMSREYPETEVIT